MMLPDWKARHPFTLGQQIWVKPWAAHKMDASRPYTVSMRGEGARGCWVTLEGVAPYEFAVDDFTASPPLPPASDEDDGEPQPILQPPLAPAGGAAAVPEKVEA